MRQDPNVYDDGASQLGMNPYMQQVGLFGKGKPKPVAPPIDIQRRAIFGLKPQEPAQANLPAVRSSDVPVPSAVPVPSQGPHPDVWAGGSFATNADFANVIKKHLEARRAENAVPEPAQPAPLTQLANKALNTPISRREVLKKTGQVALNQMLPSTSIASEVVSPLAQVAKAAPAYDKNAIIGAISSFITDKMTDTSSDLAEELLGQGVWEPDDPHDADPTTAWEYAQYGDETHANYEGNNPNAEQTAGLKTLRDNFNLQKLSEHSGIPIEELKKHISDIELQGFPLSLGNRQERLSAIMEDGRPKEAVRMTALEDLDAQEKYLKKAAKELYGKQKAFDDDEMREIAEAAKDLAYTDYVRKTLNNVSLPEGSIHEEVINKAGSNWLKSALQDVFDQGSEDWGYNSDDFYERAYDTFKSKDE
jgi:hypothetical protein